MSSTNQDFASNDDSYHMAAYKHTPYTYVSNHSKHITKSTASQKQLTFRSIIIGLFLGCILCFSNTYFGLQTGWITMGSLQSALVGYGLLQLCTKLHIGGKSNKLELNMIQTIAVASATMPLAAGFVGIIPALALLSKDNHGPVKLTLTQLFIWTSSLACFGVFVAVPLRKYLIIKEQLPFPSGTATAKMIELFYNDTQLTEQKQLQTDTNTETAYGEIVDAYDGLLLQYAVDKDVNEYDIALHRAHSDMSGCAATDLIQLNESEKNELDIVKEHVKQNKKTRSVVIATKSHSNTLNHECIELEMVYHDQAPSLASQWRVFIFTFILSSVIILTQYFMPILHYAPIFGSTANIYLWNIDISLSYVGQGMIAGTRVGLSMLLGCIIGWALLGPYAIYKDWAQPNDETNDWQNSEEGWVLWVSLSIMLGESLTSLCIILIKSLCCRNTHNHSIQYKCAEMSLLKQNQHISNKELQQTLINDECNQNNDTRIAVDKDKIPSLLWISGLLFSCVLCVVSLSLISELQLEWYSAALALVFALIISILSVRALGETDLNPVSGVGKVSQIFFSLISPGDIIGNLIAGAMSEASAAQSGDMLQVMKTGYLLSASARLQFYGVLIGTVASVVFSVFAYYLFISVYPDIPNAEFEVPAARLWLNMAELLNGGSLAINVKSFCIIGAVIGALLSLCHDVIFKYINGYIPSGVALAIGFYITPNYVIPRVIGALFQFIWYRRNKNSFDKYMIVVASGFVLGEGIFSIINAFMKAIHVPCCFLK